MAKNLLIYESNPQPNTNKMHFCTCFIWQVVFDPDFSNYFEPHKQLKN